MFFLFSLLWNYLSYSSSLQKISEKCFKKCITKPSSSLDSSEQVSQKFLAIFFIWGHLTSFFGDKVYKLMEIQHIWVT